MSVYDDSAAWIVQYASLAGASVRETDEGTFASISAKLPDGRVLSAHAGPCNDAVGRAAWELSAAVRFACGVTGPLVRHRGEVVIGIDHVQGKDLLVQAHYGDFGDTATRRAA